MVYVHPSNAAVARQLSTLLFSYEDRFDGVPLASSSYCPSRGDITKPPTILNGLVPVHANLLLFSPQADIILEGKVEMLGKESIQAIVLGFFSAAIMSDDIHEKFKFKRIRSSDQLFS